MKGAQLTTINIAKKKNFFFDFDGTLIDSSRSHNRAFKETLVIYSDEIFQSFDYESVKGQSTKDVFKKLGFKNEDELFRLVNQKQHLYRSFLQQGLVNLNPGVLHVLNLLKLRDKNLFVVTSASQQSAYEALKSLDIEKFFTGIVTSVDMKYNKPYPHIFSYCLAKYGLNRDESLVVEDALNGVIAAQAAGIDVIGVNNRSLSGIAILCFLDFYDLLEFLTKEIEEHG